jgi:hypothetical protein
MALGAPLLGGEGEFKIGQHPSADAVEVVSRPAHELSSSIVIDEERGIDSGVGVSPPVIKPTSSGCGPVLDALSIDRVGTTEGVLYTLLKCGTGLKHGGQINGRDYEAEEDGKGKSLFEECATPRSDLAGGICMYAHSELPHVIIRRYGLVKP